MDQRNEQTKDQTKDQKNVYLGEGTYGCIFKPGLDCKGNKNKKSNTVNKIQTINSTSTNEIKVSHKIRHIKDDQGKRLKYKKYFAPVIKHCQIKFSRLTDSKLDLTKCQLLNDEYADADLLEEFPNSDDQMKLEELLDEKFYMFYIPLIPGNLNIKQFLYHDNADDDTDLFTQNLTATFNYLSHSIELLNSNKIVHNDLQNYNNVLYHSKKKHPIIIDFGLSYAMDDLYKVSRLYGDVFNIENIKKYYFDYRGDSSHILEQCFVSFILYNKQTDTNVRDLTSPNILRPDGIESFINDMYSGLTDIKSIYTPDELHAYREGLMTYYSQFLDKTRFPTFVEILREVMPRIFKYCDMYAISLIYIDIIVKYLKKNSFSIDTIKIENPELYLFIESLKEMIFPNPLQHLS